MTGPRPDGIDIALTGDSLITRPMRGFSEPAFLAVAEALRGADVSITNAEMLFHRPGEGAPTVSPGGTYMQADPAMIGELRWLGIGMAAAANNHVYDYGERGLLAHLRHLRESGIPFAGIGETMGGARSPAYADTPNGRVALISVTTSGTRAMYAGHQWRDGPGRPGANLIRSTDHYTVDPDAFDALRRMRDALDLTGTMRSVPDGRLAFRDHSLGQAAVPDTDDEFYLGDLHNPFSYPDPEGYRIRRGDAFAYEVRADPGDVAENLQRIWDAKRMADRVVVSIHSHEAGASHGAPPTMLVDFAHAAIEAGADIVHGHGPHGDRGIEIHRGRPIFYSLGHFIVQNDTVQLSALDNILRQGLDPWEATPADFVDARSGAEWQGALTGLPARPDAWRDVVATVSFRGDSLEAVRLLPIELGFGRPRAQRGRPMVATGEAADEILERMRTLSEPFGTGFEIEGERAVIRG